MRLLFQGVLGATAALTMAVHGPDGPRHNALLQRQYSESYVYETETVLYVDLIPALSTSTVYQTTEITVTGCPSSVSSCPGVSIVTATTAAYTTLCPVTLTYSRVGPITSRRNNPVETSGAIPLSNSSLPSAANSSVGATTSSSNASAFGAYSTTITSTGSFAYTTASGIPSSLISSNWPATFYSTHSSTILVGGSSENVRTETETTTLTELSTSFEELTTTVPGSTCYCSTTTPTSVSLRVVGLSSRAASTSSNGSITTSRLLAAPTSNGTGILSSSSGSSALNFSFAPETTSYSSSGPYDPTAYDPTASGFVAFSFDPTSSLFDPTTTPPGLVANSTGRANSTVANGTASSNSSVFFGAFVPTPLSTKAFVTSLFDPYDPTTSPLDLTTAPDLVANSTVANATASSNSPVLFGPVIPTPVGTTASVTSPFDPYDPTISASVADPYDPNGVSTFDPYDPTASSPTAGPFDPTVVAPGLRANSSTIGVYSTAAVADPTVTNNSSANSSAVAPASFNATTSSSVAGNSQSVVFVSTTLASATFGGNISSIALRPTAQPVFSGAESETTSVFVLGLITLVYLVMFVRL